MIVYRFEGNTNYKSRKYCKKHFIEKYGREPNILDEKKIGVCNSKKGDCE